MTLQFPIDNKEICEMSYSLAELAAAERALRLLWLVVEREARSNKCSRNT